MTQTIFGITRKGTDLYTNVALGISYAPTFNSTLACNVSYQKRTASDEALAFGLSYPYNGTNFNCSGQLVFR